MIAKKSPTNKKKISFNFSISNRTKLNNSDNNILSCEGYASTHDTVNRASSVIKKGAFKAETIKNPNNIKLLWQHNEYLPIGKITYIKEDNKGLYIKFDIHTDLPYGAEAAILINKNIIDGLSIGFITLKSKITDEGIEEIIEIDLLEISICTIPCNPNAKINNKKEEYNMNQITTKEYNIFNQSNKISNNSLHSNEDNSSLIRHNIAKEIISSTYSGSALRQLAKIQSINGSSLDIIYEEGELDVGWVGEKDIRYDTNNSKLLQKRIQGHELYAQPKVTNRLMQDSAIDIEEWVLNKIMSMFAQEENHSFLLGDGDNKPHGILNNKEIERIKSSEGNGMISALDIMNMIEKLDDQYTHNSAFLMNKSTLSTIQHHQDHHGRFIWEPARGSNLKASLFGIPVYTCSFMPKSDEPGSQPVILADFKETYIIVEREGLKVSQDPYTEKPFIKFYAVKRVGGDVVNPKACKILSI